MREGGGGRWGRVGKRGGGEQGGADAGDNAGYDELVQYCVNRQHVFAGIFHSLNSIKFWVH